MQHNDDPAWELYQKQRSDSLKAAESMRQDMMNTSPLSDKAEAERRYRVVERPAIDSPPTLTSRIEVLEHTVSCQNDLINELRAELADLRALI